MSHRCIDFVYYYPVQPIFMGGCGLYLCDGDYENFTLDADSNFNRTYGVVESCAEAEDVRISGYNLLSFERSHQERTSNAVLLFTLSTRWCLLYVFNWLTSKLLQR